MSEAGDLVNGKERARLEQQAEAVRSRLERRLDALDERRDRIVELAKKAAHPPISIALLGTAAVVGVAVIAYQVHKRPSRAQRIRASFRGAHAVKPEGFLMRAFKRGALALVAALVQRVSARGLDRLLLEAPAEQPLPEVPRPRARPSEG